jgi:hypothetical protein
MIIVRYLRRLIAIVTSPRLRVSVVNPFFLIRVHPRKSVVRFCLSDHGDYPITRDLVDSLPVGFQQLLRMLS